MYRVTIGIKSGEVYRGEFHRFEGMSSTDDNSIVFAITSTEGVKGVLVDAYGVYAENLNDAMIKKLSIKR